MDHHSPDTCVHAPACNNALDPTDTMDMDTTKTDTTPIDPGPQFDSTGSNVIQTLSILKKTSLPILRQNCASGCHGGGTYKEGVNLENYQKQYQLGKMYVAFNTAGSELYKVIVTK